LHNADIQKAKLDEEQQNMSKADVNRVESAAPEEPISIKNIPTDSLRSTKESASEIITNETTTDKDISQNIKNESITFKVQILVSSKMLRKDSEQFKGIDGSLISYYKENNLYKYTYGNTSSYKEIITLKKMLADKFPGNFVIAMKGDEKISVQQALAELKN
jgi:N-acetylmuramoyl-L-alanine amidase